jgi:hypothetical protein
MRSCSRLELAEPARPVARVHTSVLSLQQSMLKTMRAPPTLMYKRCAGLLALPSTGMGGQVEGLWLYTPLDNCCLNDYIHKRYG